MRGKATGSSCVKLNSQDHPRVCGEKPERKAPRRPRLGSPPRMRGKETDSRRQCCSAGITPAYAGKRTLFCLAGRRNRDHPRVCGEKSGSCFFLSIVLGSPPRMRGKGFCDRNNTAEIRITPAYAGKSNIAAMLSYMGWGSPPRMRGKGTTMAGIFKESGITPAYAGKSMTLEECYTAMGDHPRVCGEKTKKIP